MPRRFCIDGRRLSPERVKLVYLGAPLEEFTPATLTNAAALLERLRDVRREGHAWVRDEFADGITSVAAPIAGLDGEIVAAVHVHGPTYRFPGDRHRDQLGRSMARIASQLSTHLP